MQTEGWLVHIYLTVNSSSLVVTLSFHSEGDAVRSLGLDLKVC